jgi:hypothetical protein
MADLNAAQTLAGITLTAALDGHNGLVATHVLANVTQRAHLARDRELTASQTLAGVSQTVPVVRNRSLTVAVTLATVTQSIRLERPRTLTAAQTLAGVTAPGARAAVQGARRFPRLTARGDTAYEQYMTGAATPRRDLLLAARRARGENV